MKGPALPFVVLAALMVVFALHSGRVESRRAARAPNVVVIVVDTLRADHLSPLGYARITAPRLARLARLGVTFRNALSQAPYTTKSIEALFSGDLPTPTDLVDRRRVPAWRETLAERMKSAGYVTAGFAANPYIAEAGGYHQGFDHFEMQSINYARARDVLSATVDWMEGHRDEPFFLYAHFMDVHAPYYPPPPYTDLWATPGYDGRVEPGKTAEYVGTAHEKGFAAFEAEWGRSFRGADLDRMVAYYDASIRYLDENFFQLAEAMASLGLWDDTYVFLVADHGEEFLEHGSLGHGKPLFQGQIHVPLFAWGPGFPAGKIVAEPVAVMDVMPTVLDLLGIEAPDGLYGRSLAPLLSADTPAGWQRGMVVSARPGTPDIAVQRGPLKYIRGGDGEALFHTEADSGEQKNLIAADRWRDELAALRAEADRAAAHMRAFAARQPTVDAGEVQLGDETRARLQALGYLEEGG